MRARVFCAGQSVDDSGNGSRWEVAVDGEASEVGLHRGAQGAAQGVLGPQAVAPGTRHGLPAEVHRVLYLHKDVVLPCSAMSNGDTF